MSSFSIPIGGNSTTQEASKELVQVQTQMVEFVLAFVLAVGGSAALALFSIAHMLWLEQWTNWLYYEKKLLRRRTALGSPSGNRDRLLWENYTDIASLVLPPLLLLALFLQPALRAHTVVFALHPVDIVLSTLAIYLAMDAVYFWVHRALHEVPFLYRTIHKRHHDSLPVHVFITAKADPLENLLAVSPGLCIWVLLTYYFIDVHFDADSGQRLFNLSTFLLPALTLVMEFNTGHSGYMDHWLLYVASPLQWLIKALPFARWVSAEHEEHHLSLKKNYAPMFRFFDQWAGTYEPPRFDKFATSDVVESKLKQKPQKEQD